MSHICWSEALRFLRNENFGPTVAGRNILIRPTCLTYFVTLGACSRSVVPPPTKKETSPNCQSSFCGNENSSLFGRANISAQGETPLRVLSQALCIIADEQSLSSDRLCLFILPLKNNINSPPMPKKAQKMHLRKILSLTIIVRFSSC